MNPISSMTTSNLIKPTSTPQEALASFNQAPDSIHFSGHPGSEKITNKNIVNGKLIQETAFFRDVSTLEFIKNHVTQTLAPNSPLRMANFGCSTGEETYTLAMLFNSNPNLFQIIGYDLGEKAIQAAQKGHFPILKTPNDGRKNHGSYQDSYLAFSDPTLSAKKKEYKILFESFFKVLSEEKIDKPKEDFAQTHYTQYFQLKDDTLKKDCQFKQGDIMEMDTILKPESTEIILFRNALYHLITEKETPGRRSAKYASETNTILNELFSKIHTALSKEGLFVLGEQEDYQTMEQGELIYKALEDAGFKPIYFVGEEVSIYLVAKKVPPVWQKTDSANRTKFNSVSFKQTILLTAQKVLQKS